MLLWSRRSCHTCMRRHHTKENNYNKKVRLFQARYNLELSRDSLDRWKVFTNITNSSIITGCKYMHLNVDGQLLCMCQHVKTCLGHRHSSCPNNTRSEYECHFNLTNIMTFPASETSSQFCILPGIRLRRVWAKLISFICIKVCQMLSWRTKNSLYSINI